MPIDSNVVLGHRTRIAHPDLVNIYGCCIGDEVTIAPFVEIQKNCSIGHGCKISSHSFICGGVVFEDDVIIGHGVIFSNDLYPQTASCHEQDADGDDFRLVPTRVCRGAVIGSNATIVAGTTIGEGAVICAGAIVIADVPPHAIAAGVPAQIVAMRGGFPSRRPSGDAR
jgi:UDP-2-acetamido-3-amino-2,3-dideoxy-glucuronate N-acetyltransferase